MAKQLNLIRLFSNHVVCLNSSWILFARTWRVHSIQHLHAEPGAHNNNIHAQYIY
jgi:hypothetical protein